MKCYFFSYGIRSLYLFTQVTGKLNNLSLPYNNNVFLLLFYRNCIFTAFWANPKSFSVICVNRTITLNVVRRKPSQITEWSFFSLVFNVQVHSPVLIGSFHSRQRSRSWNFWKLGLIWKSLTSDPTQTQLAGYQSQEGSIGPSVVQNTPCRRKGPEWLHLYGGFLQMENDENCWNQKARETKNFCMWRTAIQR